MTLQQLEEERPADRGLVDKYKEQMLAEVRAQLIGKRTDKPST